MRLFPPTADANARRVVVGCSLRAIGDGFVSIILPAYLLALGLDPFEVGVVATATLLGSASLTLVVGFIIGRFGHRGPLLAAAGLMVLTGLGFAGLHAFWPLLLVAFIGTLNPSGGDVSVFLPLEQSLLAQSVSDQDRTALFARYSLAGSLMGAAGTLLAALPDLAVRWLAMTSLGAMQTLFVVYAAIALISAGVYRAIEEPAHHDARPKAEPLGPSRGIVYRLAALFSIDAFAGGLLVQSLLALWLFQTFGISVTAAAGIFFWTSLLSGLSYLAAVPIAERIGLLRTMVFTHLPSNPESTRGREAVRLHLSHRWLAEPISRPHRDQPLGSRSTRAKGSHREFAVSSNGVLARDLAAARYRRMTALPALAGVLFFVCTPPGHPRHEVTDQISRPNRASSE